jgi:hypothetical protein
MRSTANQNLEELINLVCTHLLSPQFDDLYPDYPKFKRLRQPITEKNDQQLPVKLSVPFSVAALSWVSVSWMV